MTVLKAVNRRVQDKMTMTECHMSVCDDSPLSFLIKGKNDTFLAVLNDSF